MKLLAVLFVVSGLSTLAQNPKPYNQVITVEAKTRDGVFKVHQIHGRVYFEVPNAELDKDFLWFVKIAKTVPGVGLGNRLISSYHVRWHRHDDRVLLRSVADYVTASPSLPVARAVQASNHETILMSFPIEAMGPDQAPVIDVTALFTSEVQEFSARTALKARGFDQSRSFLERVIAFPMNIEIEATHTYTNPADIPYPERDAQGLLTGMPPGSGSVLMHHSIIKLPETPMMPRLADPRVGYMSRETLDYGRDDYRIPRREYISRWRLEKKDASAALSEPVKSIEIWVDPATPAKWVPYVKRGIENWRPAFEAAGFKNAIVARDAPNPQQDPDWSVEDARHTVVVWQPLTGGVAFAGPTTDPRSGEILFSTIQLFHGIMTRMAGNYFAQVGPLDPRAKKLPLPDEVAGSFIEYVVAHEVGHALGLPHNMKASSMYPAEKVRDREWVKKMGFSPSIEDYSRFNYVAQPEDGMEPAELVPRIGPYDVFAIHWGYTPIPGVRAPDQEKPVLNEWAGEQEKTAWYRYETSNSNQSDPGELSESVGDADAIQSTGLGMRNLRRVMDMLLPATADEPPQYLDEMYGRVVGQWANELLHVAAMIGGVDSREYGSVSRGARFVTLPKDRQRAAVRFLGENAFATPEFLIRSDVLRVMEPNGEMERIKEAQLWVLRSVMDRHRLARMIEQEAIDKTPAYTVSDLLADLRREIWHDLSAGTSVDPFRRNLQSVYLDVLGEKMHPAVSDPAKAFVHGELLELNMYLSKSKPADVATRMHLTEVRERIKSILDPRFAPPPAPAQAAPPTRFPLRYGIEDCFPQKTF